jgi:GNAT superfamily N-acetyltransferase
VSRLEVRELTSEFVADAAALLAVRHRAHRRDEPALDDRHEAEDVTRADVESALGTPGASGVVALDGSQVVGYLVGAPKDPATWGGNVWVEAAGHAVTPLRPDIARDLYAAIAGRWVDEGRANQHVLVPASDTGLVDAWFSLDFGQQHLHAVRESPPASFGVVPGSELVIRRAVRDDIPALVTLERVLPDHLGLSPVFSRLPPTPVEEVIAELEDDLAGSRFIYFVAEHEGRVIGSAIGCALVESRGATGLNRPPDAGDLAYVAVLPEARGRGAGRALGEAILAWSRDAGYPSVATDWRSTNLEADRAWRNLGFQPSFRRLHRAIA